MGHRGARHHQVGAHTVDVECRAQRGDPAQLVVGQHHSRHQRPGLGDAGGELGIGVGVAPRERNRIGFIGEPGADHLGAHIDVAGSRHVDGEPESVEQLRAQFALFGVHRADQHEPGVVAVRDAVAFDVHAPHRRGVEQHVDEVVVQQVDLVDVEHAAVRLREQPG